MVTEAAHVSKKQSLMGNGQDSTFHRGHLFAGDKKKKEKKVGDASQCKYWQLVRYCLCSFYRAACLRPGVEKHHCMIVTELTMQILTPLPLRTVVKLAHAASFSGPERTYCGCGRGLQVDDASHVGAH